MNILAYQEIQQVEAQLLQVDILQRHSLRFPSPQQLQALSNKNQKQSEQGGTLQNQLINKKIKIRQWLRVEEIKDSKGIIRMLIYNLLACVLAPPDKPSPQPKRPSYNRQMLNTIKCTLYSKDIHLNSLQNLDLNLKDHQAQALVALFFKNIEDYHQIENDNRTTFKYCEWMLTNNKQIEDILIAMLRYILSKLQVQGAQDSKASLNIREAIINIVEYFDLTYHSFEQMLLYHEEKMFLALSENHLMLGTYIQSQKPQKAEAKEGGKLWSGDNLVESIGGGQCLTKTQQLKRKTAVVQNDVKLFSCLLKSSRSQQQIKNSLKDYQGQTPHFKDSKEINFGKKFKDENQIKKKRQIKNEFARLILGSSHKNLAIEDSEIKEVDSHKSPSNSRNGSNGRCVNLSAKNSSDNEKIPDAKKPKGTNTQRNEINLSNKRSSQGSSIGSQTRYKNRVSVKEKQDRPTTPKAEPQKKPRFGSLGNDFEFIFPQFAQNKENKLAKKQGQFQPYTGQCPCFRHKVDRNALASNIINFNFAPVLKNKSSILCSSNSKKIQGHEAPNIVVTSPQKYKEYYYRGDRLPTFLRAIIQKNQQSHEKKVVKTNEKVKTLEKAPENKRHIFKHLSQIIPNRPGDRSPSNDRKSSKDQKKITEVSPIKKYDFHRFKSKERERLGNPEHYWKSTSNLYNRPPKDQDYRRTMEQPSASPQIQNIASPFRTHSPQKRKNKYSTHQIGAHEDKDYTQQYENVLGYKKLAVNKSEKVITYQQDNL